jgi:hypothetical protein
VQYGLRGIVYFFAEVSGLAKDLHSGKFGGVVHSGETNRYHGTWRRRIAAPCGVT